MAGRPVGPRQPCAAPAMTADSRLRGSRVLRGGASLAAKSFDRRGEHQDEYDAGFLLQVVGSGVMEGAHV